MKHLNMEDSWREKRRTDRSPHSNSVGLSLRRGVPSYCVFLHFDRLWVEFVISPTNQPVFHACITEMADEVR